MLLSRVLVLLHLNYYHTSAHPFSDLNSLLKRSEIGFIHEAYVREVQEDKKADSIREFGKVNSFEKYQQAEVVPYKNEGLDESKESNEFDISSGKIITQDNCKVIKDHKLLIIENLIVNFALNQEKEKNLLKILKGHEKKPTEEISEPIKKKFLIAKWKAFLECLTKSQRKMFWESIEWHKNTSDIPLKKSMEENTYPGKFLYLIFNFDQQQNSIFEEIKSNANNWSSNRNTIKHSFNSLLDSLTNFDISEDYWSEFLQFVDFLGKKIDQEAYTSPNPEKSFIQELVKQSIDHNEADEKTWEDLLHSLSKREFENIQDVPFELYDKQIEAEELVEKPSSEKVIIDNEATRKKAIPEASERIIRSSVVSKKINQKSDGIVPSFGEESSAFKDVTFYSQYDIPEEFFDNSELYHTFQSYLSLMDDEKKAQEFTEMVKTASKEECLSWLDEKVKELRI
ncbi:hypothetical protein PGT21_017185 [Puccinia graminis f. sp. tritici]|uniref:Uncharacterized protein n=1 Tax=Puccinia graminis f. sp. tritici TaxID=56615 RepID=A0A5B0LZB0_PUCGR|nr:hypothetical protein PGT21_017185 [Puccinia graminis f. sp. tritici]